MSKPCRIEDAVVTPSLHGEPLHVQLLAYVTQTPCATYQEMAVNFQVSLKSTRRAVRLLRKQQLVRCTERHGRSEVSSIHPAVWVPNPAASKSLHCADLFCGLGGFSQGLAQALEECGLDLATQVDLVGINHDEEALNAHELNHRWARHVREDIAKAQPRKLFPGGKLRILLASPSCVHFSTARGARPVNDQLRTHAWQVVRWARDLDIDYIIVENVAEFRSWGPVVHGRPVKDGSIFRRWVRELELLGYKIPRDEDCLPGRILNAADYGDPTSRKRFFLVAAKGTMNPQWPKQTHSKDGKVPGTKPWVPARTIIDWSLPSKSIFDRKKPLAPKTLKRMFDGLEKRNGPWIKPYLQLLRATGMSGEAAAVPIRAPPEVPSTPLEPLLLGQQSGGVARPVAQPTQTLATGGAIGLIQACLTRSGGPPGEATSVEEVAPTQLSRQHLGLAEPRLVRAESCIMATGGPSGQMEPTGDDNPLRTVIANTRLGVAEAVILPPLGIYQRDGGANQARSLDTVLNTVLAQRGAGHLVEPVLVQYNGNSEAQPVTESLPTAPTHDRFGVAEPCLVDCLGTDTWPSRTSSVDATVPSITAGGQRVGLAEAQLTQEPKAAVQPEPVILTTDRPVNNRSVARGADETLPTVVAQNERIGVAEPRLVPSEPCLVPNFGEDVGQAPRSAGLDTPLWAVTGHGAGMLTQAVLGRTDLQVSWWRGRPIINGWMLDILFRMLQPRELAAAMGFPAYFQFCKRKREAIKQIGNAVAVGMAKALVLAALRQMAVTLDSFLGPQPLAAEA